MSASRTKIMVVEDERIVALNLKQRLIRLGYDVSAVVTSGAKALAAIAADPPDIVLMDIHIDGDIDGIETAARIPPDLHLPVVYLTAYSEEATLERARQTRPYGYLLKPFSERELHATMQMVLERRRADASLRQTAHALGDQLETEAAMRRQAEQALHQAQKMEAIGELTGGVAHDFNNLLTPIIGGLDILQRRGVGDAREKRIIEGALLSAERAKTVVQRLLAFARRQPLQAGSVDVAELLGGMRDLVASSAAPLIAVDLKVEPGLAPCHADANQLEMAILNLAVNARDAMPDGGTLTITAGADEVGLAHRSKLPAGAYLRLTVGDDGVGMDDATLERAVEPFFSTKGVGKGTGLGLSMVHGLVSQLGGAMIVSSIVGEGTTIEIWLRFSDQPPATLKLIGPGRLAREFRGGVALLVDDEELVRASTGEMLGELGFTVVEASSASEALDMLGAGRRFDLLVTDHLMPGMTGAELIRAVRVAYPDLLALIISGYADVEGIEPDLPRLTKPFRHFELAESLAGLSR
ncbi:MAG TPA: response regulator [Caulobacteraceae bacterium]|jgi:signal transduction histidine kinase|nr:response regulator [Caulobacteraceae bacterium]